MNPGEYTKVDGSETAAESNEAGKSSRAPAPKESKQSVTLAVLGFLTIVIVLLIIAGLLARSNRDEPLLDIESKTKEGYPSPSRVMLSLK